MICPVDFFLFFFLLFVLRSDFNLLNLLAIGSLSQNSDAILMFMSESSVFPNFFFLGITQQPNVCDTDIKYHLFVICLAFVFSWKLFSLLIFILGSEPS